MCSHTHYTQLASTLGAVIKERLMIRYCLYSLIYLPFLRTGSYKMKTFSYFLAFKETQWKYSYLRHKSHSSPCFREDQGIYGCHSEQDPLASGHSADVSCKESTLALKHKSRKHLNGQTNFLCHFPKLFGGQGGSRGIFVNYVKSLKFTRFRSELLQIVPNSL